MRKLGKYIIFIGNLFRNREPFKVYVNQTFEECVRIGIDSLFIVAIVSTFIGAVSAVQTAYNLVSPLIPNYIISTVVRDMTIMELAPTITCIVLAGKVGSNIAGGLGTMRITEQIDAIEVMGINSTSYLVFPKILASIMMFPILVIFAASLSLIGGYAASLLTGLMTQYEYVYGLRSDFMASNINFMMVKSVVFAFLISSISAFQGYYTTGGALEVGKASTKAVTNSCIAVLCADYVLAQLFLV